jgi:hypothetical protein
MQISVTRHEAKKLFWSNPDTWYCVDGCWLRHGGYAGETHRDLSFLAYVEHVNICYDWLEPRAWTKSQHLEEMDRNGLGYSNNNGYFTIATDQALRGMEDEIRRFWRLLQELCPRLTHVLISTRSRGREPWDSPVIFLGRFLRLCPTDISVSVSLLQGHDYPGDPNYRRRMERNLWRLIDNNTDMTGVVDQWEKVLTDWTPQIILLPPKNFRGPVGAFMRDHYRGNRRIMQDNATRLLLIDAIERHHFHEKHKPFICFAPDCEVWLKAPGEYLLHAIETGHGKSATPPENLKALFDEHGQKLHRLYRQDHYEPYDQDTKECDLLSRTPIETMNQKPCDKDQAMIYEMEEEELYYREYFEKQVLLDQREHDAMRAFLYQLQHDPLYATTKPENESETWCSYLEYLYHMREEDHMFRASNGIFESLPFDGHTTALQDVS